MGNILGGLTIINGRDIWEDFGAFLTEEKRGGMENLSALLTPSRGKKDTAVSMREEHGERYSATLTPANEPRDVELRFAIYNPTRAGWIRAYMGFVQYLKKGNDGWLDMEFPQLELRLRVKYTDCGKLSPLTYLWREGVQAARFRVKFREPVPII